MKKRVFLFTAVIMLVLISAGLVYGQFGPSIPSFPITSFKLFISPPKSAAPEGNVGALGTAECSSQIPPGFLPGIGYYGLCSYANDANSLSSWLIGAAPQWIKITLKEPTWINFITLKGGGRLKGTISFSDAAINPIPFDLPDGWDADEIWFETNEEGIYDAHKVNWVMLNITEGGGGLARLTEFEIWKVATLDMHREACTGSGFDWMFPHLIYDTNAEHGFCCGNEMDAGTPVDEGMVLPFDETYSNKYRYLCARDYGAPWLWLDAWAYKFKIVEVNKYIMLPTDRYTRQYDYASAFYDWWACVSPDDPALSGTANDFFSLGNVRMTGELLTTGNEGAKILCYKGSSTDNYFIECCPDPYDYNCSSDIPPEMPSRKRELGEPENLIHRNETLKYKYGSLAGVAQNIVDNSVINAPYKGIDVKDKLSEVTDWSDYDELHFFVNMNYITDVGLIIARYKTGAGTLIGSYDILLAGLLENYVVNRFEDNKWAHVIVPVDNISNNDNVTHILFHVNVSAIPLSGPKEELIIGLKKAYLSSANTKFCTLPLESAPFVFWRNDLDINKETCNSWPSYNWTGTKCCGDDDVADNFIDTEGACWQGNPAFNNTLATENALFYDNEFYVCGMPAGTYEQAEACEVVGSFSCLHSGIWIEGIRNMTRNAPNGTNVSVIQECCAYYECWNGTECVITTSAPYAVAGLNFTCYNGDWYPAETKYDWDNKLTGFCPKPSDCLVYPYGEPANNYKTDMYWGPDYYYDWPVCIADGQFIEDHYCRNGLWTTRTRLIALQLLGLRGTGDFALYCDHYTKSLADYQYEDVEDYLGGDAYGLGGRSCTDIAGYDMPCVNHFCIIEYDNKVLFGASLNKDINDTDKSILIKVVGDSDYCSSLSGTQAYKKCSADDSVWYSPSTNSIIYSKSGEQLYGPGVWGSIANFFSSIFSFITGWQPKNILNETINLTGIEINENYDRLYVQKSGDKAVYGILTEVNPEKTIMVLRYENFTLPVCESVEKTEIIGLACNETAGKATIVGDTSAALGYWQEMTSSLRLD
jgi:hypothetical protein